MDSSAKPVNTITMHLAMVTGASRGVGRGIAIGLSDAGFNVFGTGRSIEAADLPHAIVRIVCDHLWEEETPTHSHEPLPRVVILLCFSIPPGGGYERMVEDGRSTWPLPFWEQPGHRWTRIVNFSTP